MSEIVERKLEEIIDFRLSKTNGSTLTKSFIELHKGDIPVYGASLCENEVSYGFIADNLEGIKYFDDCLTWNIDGSTAIFYRRGHFSLSEKVIPLLPFEEIASDIDLYYLRYAILFSPGFHSFDFSRKAGKGKLKKLKIVIPLKGDGSYDLEEQQRLAGIYSEIENQRQKLLGRIYEVQQLLIRIDKEEGVTYADKPLNDIVTHHNGNASYTKAWCQKHKGTCPIYSANTVDPIAHIENYDYDGEFLTYSKNGCAGYITIINGRFSINGDRCVMSINEEYTDKLDLLYLKYYLEPIFRKNKKGRVGAFGKNEFTKLNSTMIKNLNIMVPIPLKGDGSYDLDKQREIAERYKQIYEIKRGLIDKIKRLTSISVIPATSK